MTLHRVISLGLILLLSSMAPLAEDIDIFKGGGALDPAPPNVLILLDNTSNWSANNQAWKKTDMTSKCAGDAACISYVEQIFGTSTSLVQGQVELKAIELVLSELACDTDHPIKVNVGLMMLKPEKGTYSDNAGQNTDSSGLGGFIRRSVLPLDDTRCAALIGNSGDLKTIFDNVTASAWKAPNDANYGGAMFDVFKYFGGHSNPTGETTPTGHIGFGPKRFATPLTLDDPDAFEDPDKKIFDPPSPSTSLDGCGGGNHLLLVGNGYPAKDVPTLLSSPSNLNYSWDPSHFHGSDRTADVWARFLSTTDISGDVDGKQTIITSALNVYNASPSSDQTDYLKSIAKHGRGTYYEVGGNLGRLIESLRNFFLALNAANQTFAAAALPYRLGTGGLHLNQVYLGMFRPEKTPRWFGNLKRFQFIMTDPDDESEPRLVLADSIGFPVQSGTGFLADDSRSFWTQSSSFWDYRCGTGSSVGDPLLCGTPISASDSPDGPVVEKGGAAQRLRVTFKADATNSTRRVYTDNANLQSPGMMYLTADTVTNTQLGVTSDSERAALVNWIRGVDTIDENPLYTDGARPSIVGDVLHSEPVAINYGGALGCASTGNGEVVVFHATNHGLLHAVSGSTGNELWSYLPSDFLARVKRLSDNSPSVTFPAPVPANAFNKGYMIDGNLSVYAPDANGDCRPDEVLIFLSMRRGGRFIYALDVSQILDEPGANHPILLWRKGHTDTGFAELGQTWSAPKPILLPDGKPYVIFGGGYDPAADDRPLDTGTGTYGQAVTTTRTMGRGIFVVDAKTGALKRLLQDQNMSSIPSDVAVISDVTTGFADRAFVGDSAGNLWRISFRDASTGALTADQTKWSLSRIISATGAAFMHAPDVARCGGRDVILIGSGDREEPFDRTVQNRFYMIHDHDGSALTIADLTDLGTSATQALADSEVLPNADDQVGISIWPPVRRPWASQ